MRLTPGHFSGPHMPIGASGALHVSKTGAATPPRYLATLRNHYMAFDRRANGLRFERLRINAGALSVSGQSVSCRAMNALLHCTSGVLDAICQHRYSTAGAALRRSLRSVHVRSRPRR